MKNFPLKINLNVELFLSSAHMGVLSVLLLLNTFEVISMDSLLFKALISWTAFNLLALPVAKKRFITPKIANPRCHFCGAYLKSN
jgi:hypothetical protein